jgi:hypothetical protein
MPKYGGIASSIPTFGDWYFLEVFYFHAVFLALHMVAHSMNKER